MSRFFRLAGVGMAVVGVTIGVVSQIPDARAALGCGEGSICAPMVRSGGGIAASVFLMIGLIWFAVSFAGSGTRKRAERLRRVGASASGQVLEMSPTGLVVHGVPRVDVAIRVDAPSGPFVVKGRTPLPAYSGIHVGSTVTVLYDAQNPGDFVLATAAGVPG